MFKIHLPRQPVQRCFTSPIRAHGKRSLFHTPNTTNWRTHGDEFPHPRSPCRRWILEEWQRSLEQNQRTKCVDVNMFFHIADLDTRNWTEGGGRRDSSVGDHDVERIDAVCCAETFDSGERGVWVGCVDFDC